MTIERDFDVPFIAALALREKQIQQNYRPIIAVHKWFARRFSHFTESLADVFRRIDRASKPGGHLGLAHALEVK